MSYRALSASLRRAHHTFPSYTPPFRRFYSSEISKPLRILFCGSDDFSCASLRALHEEQVRDPESIASIDILCRPGKPSGRGMKNIREVPIKRLAQKLGLSIHERDTFTGWTLPRPHGEHISLVVAVSFGLFVPPRIINSTEFGGVNVHPSMLPDFRGPAPLQHTLLAEETHIGVTLQTLHPEKFDHGRILAQTQYPGFGIPKSGKCTTAELLEFITPKAADLLVKGIRDRVFDPSHQKDLGTSNENVKGRPVRHAPKITPEDRHIDFGSMTASSIATRDRTLGRLWSIVRFNNGSKKRVVFDDVEAIPRPQKMIDFFESKNDTGDNFEGLNLIRHDGEVNTVPMMKNPNGGGIIVATTGSEAVRIGKATIDGKSKTDAAHALFRQEKEGSTTNGDEGGSGYAVADIPMLVVWDLFT